MYRLRSKEPKRSSLLLPEPIGPLARSLCLLLGTGALLIGLDSSHLLCSPRERHKGRLPGRNLHLSAVPALISGSMG